MNSRFLLQCISLTVFSCFSTAFLAFGQSTDREIYELKIYHIDNAEQEEQINTFLKNAYLPALKRAGIPNVGVFKPIEKSPDHGKKIYVYIPYSSAAQLLEVPKTLEKDKRYYQAGKGYLNAPHDHPPYSRIETILLQAFEGMPHFKANKIKGSDKIYELRSYEGPTEKLFRKKVEMFNKGEIEIFHRLGFNPMFFGEVIAGSKMPNLMYMTTHADKATKKAHWDAFRNDSEWEKMKVMEEYQHTVSHIDIVLLTPADYSTL